LSPCPLALAVAALSGGVPGARVMTMAEGQWDGLLAGAYAAGWILLEVDDDERPVRAFQKAAQAQPSRLAG
jgi:hypothetical protein